MLRHLLVLLVLAGCASRAPVLPPALEQPGAARSVELADVPFFPQQDYQCGPASLAAVLRYSGVEVDAESLRPHVYLPGKQGSLQVEMAAATRGFGRIAYLPPAKLSALLGELQAGRPAVVLQNLGLKSYPVWHFAVVIGYSADTDTFILRSGQARQLQVGAYDFMRSWSLADQWSMVVLRPGELPASDDADGYLRAVAATETASPATDLTRAYEVAVERWPGNPIAHLGLANAAHRAGDTARAIDLYLELVQRAPDQIAARNNLADALNVYSCRALALQTIDAALGAAGSASPLQKVLQQTRAEILAGDTRQPEPAECRRWAPTSP